MIKNKIKKQAFKPLDRNKNLEKKFKHDVSKVNSKIVDFDELFKILTKKLTKEKIYLLDLKIGFVNKNPHIYVVIHRLSESTLVSVSHNDCTLATKFIKEIISSKGFDADSYSITVSSAGFRWVLKNDLDYFIFQDNQIKIKYQQGENVFIECATLKSFDDDSITFEAIRDGVSQIIKILKKDIIKARLNN